MQQNRELCLRHVDVDVGQQPPQLLRIDAAVARRVEQPKQVTQFFLAYTIASGQYERASNERVKKKKTVSAALKNDFVFATPVARRASNKKVRAHTPKHARNQAIRTTKHASRRNVPRTYEYFLVYVS